MTYCDWLLRLFSCAGNLRLKRDLSTMRCIDAWQGCLHHRFASIHIAGTNGKGSVALKIASAMQAAGHRVGLYTSPHISSYRERVQVNGSLIDEEFVLEFLPKLLAFVDQKKLTPTFFELLTALSFEYFFRQKIDIAVLETGLGGQFDATNVVTPILTVITSIDFDHCDILGTTLDEIAQAKAGIIKEGAPVVVGPRARLFPILDAAGANAILAPESNGFYNDENNSIARAALESMNVSESSIAAGLKRRPPCRFELVDSRPVILDVAHNPDGFAHLKQALELNYPRKRFHLVFAMGKERDAAACIRQLGDLPIRIACVSNGHSRLASAQDLQKRLQSGGFSQAYIAHSLEEALQFREPTIVCGSFFIMSDVRRLLNIQEPTDPIVLAPMTPFHETMYYTTDRIHNNDGAAVRLIH